MKLGKKPARGMMKMKFADYLNAEALPTPPKSFGHAALMERWYGLGNDTYGNCVRSGAAHEHMLWSLEGKSPRTRFTIKSVLTDYAAVTGFDPKKPETDQGTDMLVAAAYRQKTGVLSADGSRRKIDAYVALTPRDTEELALATYLMGAVGVGIQVPHSAMTQFSAGQIWDVVPGSRVEGGHYVPCVGRDENGNFLFVTWGRVQKATPDFLARYMDEGVAYLAIERLYQDLSPEGFKVDQLRRHLARL